MSPDVLAIRRVLPAAIERVFAAWASAEAMARWFVCNPSWTTSASSDFRVGGRYHIVMRDGARTVGLASGEYRAIEPPRRLVFSWRSEGGASVADSLVTVELRPLGASTELTLVHDLAPMSREGRAHHGGWLSVLASLERHLDYAAVPALPVSDLSSKEEPR